MDKKRISLIKAVSYRLTATITTILIVYVLTGKGILAFQAGLLDITLKTMLFYAHERAWNLISWGKAIGV